MQTEDAVVLAAVAIEYLCKADLLAANAAINLCLKPVCAIIYQPQWCSVAFHKAFSSRNAG